MSTQRERWSRRSILKAMVWAAPICMGAARSNPPPVAASIASTGLVDLGAREVATHIRNGDLKAEVYFSRIIEQCHHCRFLNGIAHLDEERIVTVARGIDQARSRGERLGPAAGVPVAVKDQIAVAGYPAVSGNPALRTYRPARNAVVVDALVKAGAVPFAKTTCPNMTGNSSLMAQVDSYSPAYGVVRNPYDPTRMAGGSSGGSGVVLAARMAPAALGEDTNGSIRVPAAFCGVVGFRPSTYTIRNALKGAKRKRYSDDGLVISADRLDTIGPMARSVADVAFLDEVITGERAPTIGVHDVRIGIPRRDYWDQEWVDPVVASITQAAFQRLLDAGAHLIEIDYLRLRSTVGYLGGLSAMAMAAQLLNEEPVPPGRIAEWLSANMPGTTVDEFNGAPISNQERDFGRFSYLPAGEQKQILLASARIYRETFVSNNIIAIAAPTVPILPQVFTPTGSTDFETVDINGKTLDRASVIITQTVIAPRYGAPSLSLPVGLAAGLPVGLGLDGLPGEDRGILGLGIALEGVLGSPRPPYITS